MIKQGSEYYDLYQFLTDDWDKNMEILGFNDKYDPMPTYIQREREVVSRLSTNFQIHLIKNYVTGDRNPDVKNINLIKRKILSYDLGKNLSFTDNILSGEWFNEKYFLEEREDHYIENQLKLPEDEKDSSEDYSNFYSKNRKEIVDNNNRIDSILQIK